MAALGDVVLATFDAEKGEGLELAKHYQVQGYPTFVLTNADGDVLDTWSGYGKEHFVSQLDTSLEDPSTMDEKMKRFTNAPVAKDGVTIARFLATRGAYEGALEILTKTEPLEGAPDLSYARFDYTFSALTRSEKGTVDDVQRAADAVLTWDGVEPYQLVEVADMMAHLGREHERPELRTRYLGAALEATAGSDDEGLQREHARLAVNHALLVEKDAPRALELKRAILPEGWKDDVKQLNAFAWWCFENSVNLEEAELLARRGADLAPPGKDRAMILDTAAEICNARGNCDDAVELTRQAIADHPDKEFYRKQLERFEAIRAASQAN